MLDLKLSHILSENRRLGEGISAPTYKIAILSNTVTFQLNAILEYSLRIKGIPAIVQSGSFDNLVQDSDGLKDADLVILFWELGLLLDDYYGRSNTMSDEDTELLVNRTKAEIDLVSKNLDHVGLVLWNQFSSLVWNSASHSFNRLDDMKLILNAYALEKFPTFSKLVNLDRIIASMGLDTAIDWRFFYSSRALYTSHFYKKYSQSIQPFILAHQGQSKKAIVFDCDNTLWKGVLGEDGFLGIQMSDDDAEGRIFRDVQLWALDLTRRGILLGLCSKNNQADVDEVLQKHPDCRLSIEVISSFQINWDDKATNLRRIAKDLNIGLDQLVYVDDSEFELEWIRSQCPEVMVLKVPENLSNYPSQLKKIEGSFLSLSASSEDSQRIQYYHEERARTKEKTVFGNTEDYLRSLELRLKLYIDWEPLIPRMSQMTLKTNQFNLTTQRYTEAEIYKFIQDKSKRCFACEVNDRLGGYGVAVFCIVDISKDEKRASITQFLMSCRVIGRNIEYTFFDYIFKYLQNLGIVSIKAKFISTSKNRQVSDFYDRLGFIKISEADSEANYQIKTVNPDYFVPDYIGVVNGREN